MIGLTKAQRDILDIQVKNWDLGYRPEGAAGIVMPLLPALLDAADALETLQRTHDATHAALANVLDEREAAIEAGAIALMEKHKAEAERDAAVADLAKAREELEELRIVAGDFLDAAEDWVACTDWETYRALKPLVDKEDNAPAAPAKADCRACEYGTCGRHASPPPASDDVRERLAEAVALMRHLCAVEDVGIVSYNQMRAFIARTSKLDAGDKGTR